MVDGQRDHLDKGLPPALDAGIFGADPGSVEAQLILIPVPWEATTSYGRGTAKGPQAILKATHQLDLYDEAFGEPYKAGIHMLDPLARLSVLNEGASARAKAVIQAFDSGKAPCTEDLAAVNQASAAVNRLVEDTAAHWLDQGKIVGLIGGDHSSPLGLMAALAQRHPDGFDILHFDAHHDLREAYHGFTYSHASIMFNALESLPAIRRLVQVGIRDYSRSERDFARAQEDRVQVFYDRDLFAAKAEGRPFAAIAHEITESLGTKVYVSFDIDGLDPAMCPSTGTPVVGGLSFQEASLILETLAQNDRQVIGFDLCEVAPSPLGGEWDANVGARVLYKLCGAALRKQADPLQ